jgi:hypothetical protein
LDTFGVARVGCIVGHDGGRDVLWHFGQTKSDIAFVRA